LRRGPMDTDFRPPSPFFPSSWTEKRGSEDKAICSSRGGLFPSSPLFWLTRADSRYRRSEGATHRSAHFFFSPPPFLPPPPPLPPRPSSQTTRHVSQNIRSTKHLPFFPSPLSFPFFFFSSPSEIPGSSKLEESNRRDEIRSTPPRRPSSFFFFLFSSPLPW